MDLIRDKNQKQSKNIQKAWSAYHRGDLNGAVGLAEKEIKKQNNRSVDPWILLGRMAFDQKDYGTACQMFSNALAIEKKAELYYDLGICLNYNNQALDAIKSLLFAVKLQADAMLSIEYQSNLKTIIKKTISDSVGISAEIYQVLHVFLRQPDCQAPVYNAYIYFLNQITEKDFNKIELLIDDLEYILEKDFGDLHLIRPIVAYLIHVDADFNRIAQGDYDGLDEICQLFSRKLLYYYFEKYSSKTALSECLLTVARTAIMQAILNGDLVDDKILFLTTIVAKQAWKSEYVFYLPEQEQILLERLSKENPEVYDLVALMYQPLLNHQQLERISKRYDDHYVQSLIELLSINNLIKQEQVNGLINLSDDSAHVQQMYEENPYPRWTYHHFLKHQFSIQASLSWFCRREHLHINQLQQKPKILVAGCGTGQQPISIARNTEYQKMTAIDLSHSSLRYAQYMAKQVGESKIQFYQADILNLTTDNIGKFDYIECGGVLHHLKEPQKGWQVLVNLLENHGAMKIGLYSQVARNVLNLFRAQFKSETKHYDIEKLHKIRNDIIHGKLPKYEKMLKWGDFYSTSAFRDLVAHVQESQFTIPKIKDYLTQLGLEFLGFHVSASIKQQFLSYFNQQQDCLYNLDCWHEFELKHPDTFAGMYQFWCQKLNSSNC